MKTKITDLVEIASHTVIQSYRENLICARDETEKYSVISSHASVKHIKFQVRINFVTTSMSARMWSSPYPHAATAA